MTTIPHTTVELDSAAWAALGVQFGAIRRKSLIDEGGGGGGGGPPPPPSGAVPTEGDDTLTGTDGGETIDALGGNDTVYALAGDDAVNGGSGNDTLGGGSGTDNINGGDGNDSIFGALGDDTMVGGEGIDFLRYDLEEIEDPSFTTEYLMVILRNGFAEDRHGYTDLFSGFEGIIGTSRSDGLGGDDGANQLEGRGGDDLLIGYAGDDILKGDAGDDNLQGRAGNDTLEGGEGNDTLIYDGLGNDPAHGGAGTDKLVINFSGSSVEIVDNPFALSFNFEAGYWDQGANSVAFTAIEQIEITTGTADDRITTYAGDDIIRTGAGDDRLNGGTGADEMIGGAGNDTYTVDDASDIVTELEGAAEGTEDTLYTSLGVRGATPALTDLYVLPDNVENLFGTSAGAQGVQDNSLNNNITMFNGNDLVVADQGGEDVADGGAGNDFLYFGNTWGAGDRVNGSEGYDTLGLLGTSRIIFDEDDLTSIEQLSVYSSGDELAPSYYVIFMNDANVAAGATLRVQAESLTSNEFLHFNGQGEFDGKFLIRAGAGNDRLLGGSKNDDIQGNAGDDTINGGAGKDWIVGGLGADILTGGTERDTFVYTAANQSIGVEGGYDRILDFEVGVDKINLRGLDADGDTANGITQFTYLGDKAFTGKAGELNWFMNFDGEFMVVQADLDGDMIADLYFTVVTGGMAPLTRNDFEL